MFNKIRVYSGSSREAGKSLLARRAWFDETGASTVTPVIQGDAVEHQVSSVPAVTTQAPSITDDVVKGHPLYKSVLSETIERRQEIARLKAELEAAKRTSQEVSDTTPATTGKDIKPDEIQKLIDARFAEVQTKAAQEALFAQYKVPAEMQDLWRDNNIEAMTKRLQAAYGKPQNGGAGNGTGNADPHADLAQRIKERVTGQGPSAGANLYTPESMAKLRGGVILP